MGKLGLTFDMQVTATNNALGASANQSILPTKELTQRDFLKLLVVQMTTQDPLKPIENQDMLAQLVQFSTLEQSTGLQLQLARMHDSQEFLQANSLIGREVSLQVNANTITQGVVSGVDMLEGIPKLIVNGEVFSLKQVLMISPATANQ
jgi:flagellar basal-body rod modification protein FlgD